MQSITDFISNLLPTFGRDRILEDLRITKGDVSNIIPLYTEAARLFKGKKPESPELQELFGTFKRVVGGPGADNAVVHIAEHLPEVLANIDAAERLVSTFMNTNVAGAGLTLKQANILRYCDGLFLVSKYARKFLNMAYVYTAAEYKDLTTMAVTDSIPPVELTWLKKTMLDFCYAYLAALGSPADLHDEMADVPDIELGKTNPSMLETTIGAQKTDPRRLNFIGTKANPIYFIRMMIAEWQVRRWKAAKEELAALQLRQYQLQKLQKGQADAKIEKQLMHLESRIQTLNFEIAEMEK